MQHCVRAKLARRLAIVLASGAALAGCGASVSSLNSTTTTTTTTTTTLPSSSFVAGSNPANFLAFIGPIWRLRAPLLANGASAPRAGGADAGDLIGYRQFGSGPDLLLIMGEHGSMSSWDPQLLSDLAGHFRVTIFDLPGVGYSEGIRPVSAASYADATAGLIYALGLKTPTVLGWGLGGTIALALAEQHPDFVARLILVDSSPGGRAAVAPAPAVRALLASPDATTAMLSQLYFPQGASSARVAWLSRLSQVVPDDIVASAVRTEARLQAHVYASDDVLDALGAVRAATLVVSGALDEVVPRANATALEARLHNARLVVFDDAGYGALAQDEQGFFAAVLQFVTSTPLTTTTTTPST